MPCCNTIVWWTTDRRRAAYTISPHGRGKCSYLVAADACLAVDVLATVRPDCLSNHPYGWLVNTALDPVWSSTEAALCEAGIALELQPGVLGPYLAALTTGRTPGYPAWPLPFQAAL